MITFFFSFLLLETVRRLYWAWECSECGGERPQDRNAGDDCCRLVFLIQLFLFFLRLALQHSLKIIVLFYTQSFSSLTVEKPTTSDLFPQVWIEALVFCNAHRMRHGLVIFSSLSCFVSSKGLIDIMLVVVACGVVRQYIDSWNVHCFRVL